MAEPGQVKAVFLEAAELPAGERSAVLERLCADDVALRTEVEALLREHDHAGGFLAATAVALKAAGPAEGAGTRVGPYKLLELIGEGGFGSVYLAEQREPVSRRVAVKIIKLGMDTKAVIARFEAERQALALMEHPHIARVLDAGATETGRPYFVMELVAGEPITAYCGKKKLGVADRLGLFVQVCQAVQHAHQKGIIHRDLKPGNILVSTQDGRPHAKVVDFGIAKATAHRLTEKTLFTEHRALLGTPEYMSPEQAESSLDIDTRTDVYSLGVLLYELLTGTTPFEAQRLREAAYAEIQRIIREEEPEKPSTRLSKVARTAGAPNGRGTEPRLVGTLVKGDLDWIALKCLEKDRARRYPTANALAQDIERHLKDEPVMAGPPSRVYRARKFVRRNRGPVAAAVAIMAVLVLGVVGTTWGMVWALGERARADAARDGESAQKRIALENEAKAGASARVARAEAARAQAALDVVKEVLASPALTEGGRPGAEPDEVGPSTFVQRLEDFSRAWGFEEHADPVVEAEVRLIVGRWMRSAGAVRSAVGQFQRSYEVRRRLHGELYAQTNTALAAWLEALVASGERKEAVKCANEAVERARAEGRPDHFELAERLHHLGNICMWTGDYVSAERAAMECREVRERSCRTRSQRYADDLCLIGNVAVYRRDWGTAEGAYLESAELNRQLTGELAEGAEWQEQRLSEVYMRIGGHARAVQAAREWVERGRRALTERTTPEERLRLAARLHVLALRAMDVDALEEAERAAREAVELRRERPQLDPASLSRAVYMVGYVCWVRGDHSEAERWLRECLSPEASEPGVIGWRPQAASVLGNIVADRGDVQEAEALSRAGHGGNRNQPNHWTHWLGRYELALICRLNGKSSEAEELERLAEGKDLRGMARSLAVGMRVGRVGAGLTRLGLHAKAERFLYHHESIMRGLFPEGWRRWHAASQLAAGYAVQTQFAKAEPLMVESAERLIASAGAPREHVKAAVERAAAMYEAWEQADPGKGHEERAAAWRERLEAITPPPRPG